MEFDLSIDTNSDELLLSVCRVGSLQVLQKFSISLDSVSFDSLKQKIAHGLELRNSDKMRLFSFSGIELFDETDLHVLERERDNFVFVSEGRDFNFAVCLEAYELTKKLGAGSFGEVYLATDKRSGN